MMRFRLRTLLIVLALACCTAIAEYCAIRYGRPIVETEVEMLVGRVAVNVYPWLKPRGLE